MDRDSTADEDDHLVSNLDLDGRTPAQRPDDNGSISSLGRFGKRYNRCLVCVCATLLIAIVAYSVDLSDAFSVRNVGVVTSSDVKDGVDDGMRKAELRALYLLKQQEIGLVSALNVSTLIELAVKNLKNSAVGSNEKVRFLLDDFKYVLEKQIMLNREVQEMLLSPHRPVSLMDLNDTVGSGGSFGDVSGKCRKVDQKLGSRKTTEWKPRSNKYLFAICTSGQMSNHLICLEKHMVFAALLDRVLVIPSSVLDYDYRKVIDIEHVNECVGQKVVVTFHEFSKVKTNHLHIDRFICYFSLPEQCYVDREHLKSLRSLGISIGKIEPVWVEDIRHPVKRTIQDVKAKFISDEDVIAIGDVFYADMEQEWVMQPGGPLAHKCKTLIEPSKLIRLTAQRFIQTFLGKDFVALHFRRHGFLKFWYVLQVLTYVPKHVYYTYVKRLSCGRIL